jgi:hypothetical protein
MLLLKDDDVQRVFDHVDDPGSLEVTQRDIARGDMATLGRIDVYLPCATPDSYYRWAVMTGGEQKGLADDRQTT